MAQSSKRFREAQKKVDSSKRYAVAEAVAVLKTFPPAKFDETVEISMRLGVDVKQPDQMLRGSASLPKGLGKEKRVIAFCVGTAAEAAKEAGAVEAGGEELVKKVQDGWTDFDIAVAAPDMMRIVGRLGRVLGPQGKMPSPKSGTVAENVPQAVREFRAGRMEYRTDATGNLHAPVGKLSFSEEDLRQNAEAFIAHIQAARPASVKGVFIVAAYLSSTMSPAIRLAV
jgi:large subunit ribosomal protein L1